MYIIFLHCLSAPSFILSIVLASTNNNTIPWSTQHHHHCHIFLSAAISSTDSQPKYQYWITAEWPKTKKVPTINQFFTMNGSCFLHLDIPENEKS